MAPPSTKAIIYEDSDTRASWAPHGLNAWLPGPSKDHYCCHLYYLPKTSGYRVSGSADLFNQHCIALPYLHETHINKLAEELKGTLKQVSRRALMLTVLCTLAHHLDKFISGTPPPSPAITTVTVPLEEKRVIPSLSPQPPPLQRVTTAPATILASSPTAPRILRAKTCTHQQKTRSNTPGMLPMIIHAHHVPPLPLFTKINIEPTTPSASTTTTAKPCQSNRINFAPLPRFHNACLICQEAINSLVLSNKTTRPEVFTPLRLCPAYARQDLEHYGLAMVHPVTHKQITSYC
jgi:hypothetical protein